LDSGKSLIIDKQLYWERIEVGAPQDAPVLVFLHEALGSVAMWKSFPTELCQTCGLNGLVYDRQGHGHSDPLTLPRTKDYLEIEAWTYLPELLQTLKINNPILFGHSDGGSIALLYASKYECTAVITEAAHIYVEDITLKGIQSVIAQMEKTQLPAKLSKYHTEKTEALITAWTDTWLSEDFQDWNIQDQLPNIKAPCLLLQGAADEYATPQHLQNITDRIGENAQSILLDNCAHIPHFQSKEQVLQITREFLLSINH
jgi:pimeloyl-ACP methyl ester carboxylesterase